MKNKLFSFEVSFSKKPRGKKGEGRATIYKPVNLPKEVLEELRIVKSIYEMRGPNGVDENGYPTPAKISYGQLIMHWINNLAAFDKEIAEEYEESCRLRKNHPVYPVDPTVGDVWEQNYYFINIDGDEYPAILDEKAEDFFADYKGLKVSVANMALNDFDFQNEAGIDITPEQAKAIAHRIIKYNASLKKD